MGCGVSCHSILGSDCTSFETRAQWGSSFEANMSAGKSDDHQVFWHAKYQISNQNSDICQLSLKASRDGDGVKSIKFTLSDHSAENKTDLEVKITRARRYGLREEITDIKSSGELYIFTRDEDHHSTVETTIVSYGGRNSLREGLFVLEMKKLFKCDDAYMVTLAHYYVTQERGLSVTAKILSKDGNCLDVEVEGPFKHPSTDLCKVLIKTCRTGEWSPNGCSHCSGANNSTGTNPPKASKIKFYYQGYTHNSGIFNGPGNGSSVGGDFDASTSHQ